MMAWDANFMSKRRNLHWRADLICGAIDEVLHPKTVLDVGCATGDLIGGFMKRNILTYGIDISPEARRFADIPVMHRIRITDFTQPHPLWQLPLLHHNKFDLVMAVEFFSVIDPIYHSTVVLNMVESGNRWLVCCGEEKRFGLEKRFERMGITLRVDKVGEIRSRIEQYRKKLAIKAFYNGLMYFERQEQVIEH
jgi:SAM-dependent methyltransferase